MEHDIIKILKNSNLKFYNPFKDENFFILMMEVFRSGNKERWVDDIKLLYKKENKEIIIYFYDKDIILTLSIFFLIIDNDYAFDPNLKIKINSEFINIKTHKTKLIYDEFLKKLIKLLKNYNEIIFIYNNDSLGENAFNVIFTSVIFKIDKYHDDSYYLEKELESWK